MVCDGVKHCKNGFDEKYVFPSYARQTNHFLFLKIVSKSDARCCDM